MLVVAKNECHWKEQRPPLKHGCTVCLQQRVSMRPTTRRRIRRRTHLPKTGNNFFPLGEDLISWFTNCAEIPKLLHPGDLHDSSRQSNSLGDTNGNMSLFSRKRTLRDRRFSTSLAREARRHRASQEPTRLALQRAGARCLDR